MPKRLPFIVAFSFLAVLGLSSYADTVTLKSGEKLEGTVVSETTADVVFNVKVSSGISDERTIPKTEIAKIEKSSPDEPAWQAIKNVQLGANSMSPTQYERSINGLRAFVNQFPKSAHAADVQKTLTAFEEEKK